jgi:hypothetical protein
MTEQSITGPLQGDLIVPIALEQSPPHAFGDYMATKDAMEGITYHDGSEESGATESDITVKESTELQISSAGFDSNKEPGVAQSLGGRQVFDNSAELVLVAPISGSDFDGNQEDDADMGVRNGDHEIINADSEDDMEDQSKVGDSQMSVADDSGEGDVIRASSILGSFDDDRDPSNGLSFDDLPDFADNYLQSNSSKEDKIISETVRTSKCKPEVDYHNHQRSPLFRTQCHRA